MKHLVLSLILGLFTLTPALAATAQSDAAAKPAHAIEGTVLGCYIPPVAV